MDMIRRNRYIPRVSPKHLFKEKNIFFEGDL